MDLENTNIKMVIIFRVIFLKIKNEDMEVIILLKEEFFKLNLHLHQHKFQKLYFQMDLFIMENINVEVGRVQAKLTTQMAAHTMESGNMIKNMELVN
jgi:hypothetical protein